MEFFSSLFSREGVISILLAITISLILVFLLKNKGIKHISKTKSVLIVILGSILYGVVSLIGFPVSPNTYFRISIAILTILGTLFGPLIGFLVGFIGHVINDTLIWNSVWWSWVFISGILGLFAGLINLDSDFNITSGDIRSKHMIKMYLLALISIFVAGFIAFLGDTILYREPASIVWIEIIIVSISNYVVIALLGIPSILFIANRYTLLINILNKNNPNV